jgi:acyl-CoA dehydrogenase
MHFGLPPELERLRRAVRAFVDERVIPVEEAVLAEYAGGDDQRLRLLQAEARAQGLWLPHLPKDLGGRGLGTMAMVALFREMGRSLAGPRAFNCDAPDQGNMDLLARAARPSVKERWLKPLCEGEITSAFCMTEPAPGAGADPSNLATRAVRDGDGWVIDGHKWYSTGGGTASFLIVMARTGEDPRTGATLFVVDRHAAGVEHVRDVPTMGPEVLHHREAELKFAGVRVDADAVLGQPGEGFKLAQERLVPARLTHCMRWLGLADRALGMCRNYVSRRSSFGRTLAEHQQVQAMIARNAAAIHAGDLMTFHCAWRYEEGGTRAAQAFSSMTKNHVAQLLCQVLDDAIQMHGGLGYSDDLPFARWYRMARAARIADGPDEVHTAVVAREFLAERLPLLL